MRSRPPLAPLLSPPGGTWYNDAMNVFSPAKVNLTLRVLGTRPDGFHELDSVAVPLGLGDEVTLERAGETSLEMVGDGVDLSAMPEDVERNLAVRAVRLLERTVGRALPTRLRIRKRIPLGGGLGGGSSNAAAVLRGMDALWERGLGRVRLCAGGAAVGAEVPRFVLDGTVRMRGRAGGSAWSGCRWKGRRRCGWCWPMAGDIVRRRRCMRPLTREGDRVP